MITFTAVISRMFYVGFNYISHNPLHLHSLPIETGRYGCNGKLEARSKEPAYGKSRKSYLRIADLVYGQI